MRSKLSPEQINYAKAKAVHDTLCDIVKKCKIKVLKENEFYISEGWPNEGERIDDPTIEYLMSNSEFDKYCRLTFEEFKRIGISPKDYNTVPTHEAWKALHQAEKELIEWGYSVLRKKPEWKRFGPELEGFKDKLDSYPEIKQQVIDLTMRLKAC